MHGTYQYPVRRVRIVGNRKGSFQKVTGHITGPSNVHELSSIQKYELVKGKKDTGRRLVNRKEYRIASFGHLFEQLHQLLGRKRIEATGRLVEENNGWVRHELNADTSTSFFTCS